MPHSNPAHPRLRRSKISIPPYLTLYSIDFLVETFEPFGITEANLIAFLEKDLHLPLMEVGSTLFFDPLDVALALRVALRQGARSFSLPGSSSRNKRGGRRPKALPTDILSCLRTALGRTLANARLNASLEDPSILSASLSRSAARLIASSTADLLANASLDLATAELNALEESGHTIPASLSVTPDYSAPNVPDPNQPISPIKPRARSAPRS